ncbi:MAG: SGNH/GDSL hydrolase family protein [Lachnospiraceae bacterium]|nr:SGNH/GDSL hydrolase family protein [Lachnospiraceae bacterium]
MKKKTKRNLLICGGVLASMAGALAYLGYQMKKHASGEGLPGNDEAFSVKNTPFEGENVLTGKQIIFLGSSVTYGSAALGESFVDFLEKRDGVIPYKEAVSGTTLVDEEVRGKASYIARLKTIDPNFKADAFICQLSTNDATLRKPLGEVSEYTAPAFFDTHTVAGALEYVIAYAKNTWNCPVIFYVGTKYRSKQYAKMIELLYELQQKWGIGILDLWHDPEMNAVAKNDYKLYMANGIHPTRAGYLKWWTPKFETYLKALFARS